MDNKNSNNQYFQTPELTQTITPSLHPITILAQAWDIYKRRFPTFLGIMIIPTLITFVSGMFLVMGFIMVVWSNWPLFFSNFTFTAEYIKVLIIYLIYLLVPLSLIIYSQVRGQTALLYAIKDSQEGIGVIEAYRRGRAKTFSYLWIIILMDLIIFGGLLLLVIPGIIFAIWFILAPIILITEDLKGMNALRKSREYVKGYWWSVFKCAFFVIILGLVILLIPIPAIITIPILFPLIFSYYFVVYSNLRAIKGEIDFTSTSR